MELDELFIKRDELLKQSNDIDNRLRKLNEEIAIEKKKEAENIFRNITPILGKLLNLGYYVEFGFGSSVDDKKYDLRKLQKGLVI